MNETERIGRNIRQLRLAYGETQEQLGWAIGVEKNTISQYEKGRRDLSKDLIKKIGVHFGVSIEELINCDLSGIEKITIDEYALWRNIDLLLPIISTPNAKMNEHFCKALEIHKRMYRALKALNMDGWDEIDELMNEYAKAADEEDIENACTVNFIGLMMLTLSIMKNTPETIEKQPAALLQVLERNSKLREEVSDIEERGFFTEDDEEMLEEIHSTEMMDTLTEGFTSLKKSEFRDLADYYAGLMYFWNLVDNEMGREFNARVAVEMESVFLQMGNKYASRFFRFIWRSYGWEDKFSK